MAKTITVPSVGESISEGVLSQWLKNNGDFVKKNEPLFELETEKATQEISAPADGVLEIVIAEGETVAVGDEVGRIEPGKELSPESAKSTKPSSNDKEEVPPAAADKQDQDAEPIHSPAVRHLLAEHNLDADQIQGTGRGGRLTKEDVQRHLAEVNDKDESSQTNVAAESGPTGESRQRMSPLRKRIAQRLIESQQTTATLTTFNEADMSAVIDLRKRYKERFLESHDVGLGFLSFFVKASLSALKAFPVVGARIDGADVVTPANHHIGVAVSTERGLFVPVVQNAAQLSFSEIEQEIARLARKARDGKISPDDLRGGTFTITNGGVFGSMLSTPILNPPQSGILGMHAIQNRPIAVGQDVVIRPMMYLALSYDHRLIDGREAVQFLVRIKECIEDPTRMLLEV